MMDIPIGVVAAIAGLIGGAVGFHLGYERAMKQTVTMLELLRAETDAYLKILGLSKKEQE